MSKKIYTKDNLDSICMDALIIYEVVLEHEAESDKDEAYPSSFAGAIREYRRLNGTYELRDWCIRVAKKIDAAWHDADRCLKNIAGEYDPSECAYDFEWIPEVLTGFYKQFVVGLEDYVTSRFEFYAMRDWVERFTCKRITGNEKGWYI